MYLPRCSRKLLVLCILVAREFWLVARALLGYSGWRDITKWLPRCSQWLFVLCFWLFLVEWRSNAVADVLWVVVSTSLSSCYGVLGG